MSNWEDRLALYDKLIATIPDLERKGKGVPYTSANGHMFSQLNKEGEIGIRLPKEEFDAFMTKYDATPFTAYGATMKGYVTLPEALLKDVKKAKPYLKIAYDFVLSMKPK